MNLLTAENHQLVLLEAYDSYSRMKFACFRKKEHDRRFNLLMSCYQISKEWHSQQNPVDPGVRKVGAILYDIEHMYD